jgi:hypothetical protein
MSKENKIIFSVFFVLWIPVLYFNIAMWFFLNENPNINRTYAFNNYAYEIVTWKHDIRR